jgi:hypothetical protein
MLAVVRDMLRKFFPSETRHRHVRLHCVDCLCTIYGEMSDWGDASPAKVGKLARQHVVLFAELSRDALAVDVSTPFWNCTPSIIRSSTHARIS